MEVHEKGGYSCVEKREKSYRIVSSAKKHMMFFCKDKVFAELIKLRRGHIRTEWALIQHDWCPHKKKNIAYRHRGKTAI